MAKRKVDIENIVRNRLSDDEHYTRLDREGKGNVKTLLYPTTYTMGQDPATAGGADGLGYALTSTGLFLGKLDKFAGKAWWVEELHVYASKALYVNITIQNDTASTAIRPFQYKGVMPAGLTRLPVKKYLFAEQTITFSGYGSPFVNTDKVVFSATAIYTEITDDLNFTADKKIVFVGDSLTEGNNIGTIGTYRATDLWTYKVRDYYLAKGHNVRHINMGQAGQKASECETARQQGRYSIIADANLVFWMQGINDVGGTDFTDSAARATYSSNAHAFMDYFLALNKTGTLVMLGTPPVEGATKHTGAETIRSLLSTAVTDKASSRVKFFSLAGAYARTNRDFYYTSEPANNAVHYNVAGAQAIYDFLRAGLLDVSLSTLP